MFQVHVGRHGVVDLMKRAVLDDLILVKRPPGSPGDIFSLDQGAMEVLERLGVEGGVLHHVLGDAGQFGAEFGQLWVLDGPDKALELRDLFEGVGAKKDGAKLDGFHVFAGDALVPAGGRFEVHNQIELCVFFFVLVHAFFVCFV